MEHHTSPLNVLLRAFPGIPESEAQELAATGEVCSYPANTILCHEDAYETTFYIILKGEVRVTKVIENDQLRDLKTLLPGDFFGEMALIHNAPRAATVMTTQTTQVLEIRKEEFDELLRRSASLSLAMAREVSRRLRENDAMAIEDLRLKAGELASAYQRLAEQEFARHEFLTTIAHELRTPLTAASGFLYMIQSGQMQGEILQTALTSVARNVQQIVTLVNDILFLQEEDLILPGFQPVELGAVVTAAVEKRLPELEDSPATLSLWIAPDLPPITGDAKSLERAIAAILDNAIKFSPDGGEVKVSAGRSHKQAWVEVCDPGVGIPEEVLPRIFDRFFHTDEIGGRMFGGVGLGLSIARHVVEQHGGSIIVKSQVGAGSTVTIRVPIP